MGDTAASKSRDTGSYVIWPVIVITISFFGYIGYLISSMERPIIMQNWDSTRCSVLVMFAASYFKPENDPRTPGQYATDNFSFCMKSLVHDVMEVVMTPFMDVFSGQASSANIMTEMMNGIREIITAMYNAFLSFIEPFLLKFMAVTYQFGIKMQHIRTAFRRLSAMALNTVFTGLTFIKGIQNAIDFVIKIVMIILIILVVLIILLFFILFPLIPLILAVIAVIVAAGTASVAATAGGMKGTFCFEPSTQVVLESGSSIEVQAVTLGTVLHSGAVVTDIMKLDGTTSPLYSLNGILVSGSHLVLGPDGSWLPVQDDPRAIPTGRTAPVLYCFNTSTHQIPVKDTYGQTVWFRDWEEMRGDDHEAHKEWEEHVSDILGGVQTEQETSGTCMMDPALQVLTVNKGLLPLNEVELGDVLYLDHKGIKTTKVLGLVKGDVAVGYPGRGWFLSCIVHRDAPPPYSWVRRTTLLPGPETVQGAHLITDTGLLRLMTPTGPLLIRDMTETGLDQIHKTYDFVLRSLNRPLKNKSASTTETA